MVKDRLLPAGKSLLRKNGIGKKGAVDSNHRIIWHEKWCWWSEPVMRQKLWGPSDEDLRAVDRFYKLHVSSRVGAHFWGSSLIGPVTLCQMCCNMKCRKFLLSFCPVFALLECIDFCVTNREEREALGYFKRMEGESLPSDAFVYVCILQAWGRWHQSICSHGQANSHDALGNALVDMYTQCDVLKGTKVYDELLV